MTKEELFEKHIAFAYFIANKYSLNYSNEMEDIKQNALVGLWKACCEFDESKGFKFTTFAYYCVNNRYKYGIEKSYQTCQT